MNLPGLILSTLTLLAGTPAFASADTYLCRCYAEPKHLFAGDIRVTAKHPVDAAQKAELKCKAQAWGVFGANQWSMDTCFKH